MWTEQTWTQLSRGWLRALRLLPRTFRLHPRRCHGGLLSAPLTRPATPLCLPGTACSRESLPRLGQAHSLPSKNAYTNHLPKSSLCPPAVPGVDGGAPGTCPFVHLGHWNPPSDFWLFSHRPQCHRADLQSLGGDIQTVLLHLGLHFLLERGFGQFLKILMITVIIKMTYLALTVCQELS